MLSSSDRGLIEKSSLSPQERHRAKLELARLLKPRLSTLLASGLDLAHRFLEGNADEAELREARQDIWAHVTGLACGVTKSDSSAAHIVLTCLETRPDSHSEQSLLEEVDRLSAMGVLAEDVREVLKRFT